MVRAWSFFNNPFISAAGNNYKKAFKISGYTNAQLMARQADPFFGPLFTVYSPLHQALSETYNNWNAQSGAQKGATLSFYQLLKNLCPGKVTGWEHDVTGTYAKDSPGYVAIFPRRHKPFQQGENDQRVAAVKQLSVALTADGSFPATLADVNLYYKQLLNARNTQQGNIGNTSSNSDAVSAATQAAMTGLYSILGSCIAQFAADPTQAEAIFDLETIRSKNQSVFTGTVPAAQNKLVAEHSFAADDELTVLNDGAVALNLYLAANKDDAPAGYTLIAVNAGENKTVKASDFGVATNTFLRVANNDAAAEGKYRVEL
jgi:hypothetical protein